MGFWIWELEVYMKSFPGLESWKGKWQITLLKGLAMIFAGQENPLIISRSKEIYIYLKTNNKIPINLLKLWGKTGFLASLILEGTLTVFLIS